FQGRPDTNSPVDNRAAFEMMVRTDLKDRGETIRLCCGSEVAALRGESDFEPIEIKTAWEEKGNGFFSLSVNVMYVMQSELVGVKSIVTGIEDKVINENEEAIVVVHKVIEEKVNDLKSGQHVSEAVGKGYSFLYDVLSKLQKLIVGHEACVVSFDPKRREVAFKSITRQEAEKMGNGVTDEFLTRFKVHQRKVIAVTDAKKHPNGREAAVERMRVTKQDYEIRSSEVANHKVISEYSVTIDREVKNDRSNTKYLVEANIRDGVNFDLAKGLDTFIDMGVYLLNEPCLHPLCKWAIVQPGATIKQVFDGADFACWRGTLKRIAMTLIKPKIPWTVVAQDFGGVILIFRRSYSDNRV
ncbi:hypothetical protein PMAYCL1PPCAC_24907, partial [Pristionchus mayeri]